MALRRIAGQRQVRPAGKVELMVVVFLDHAEFMHSRQLQQPSPATGTDIEHAHRVQPAQRVDLLDPAALLVQVHGHQPSAQPAEDLPCRRIAQALDQHHVPGLDQRTGGQVQRHLHALGKADMLCLHIQAAVVAQHLRQRATQIMTAAVTAVAHRVAGEAIAQGIAVVTMQHGLGQQPMVTGTVIEEQRTGPLLQCRRLVVCREIGASGCVAQHPGE
ncbi:hypothetical protein WR25_16825 [Diploscapter pachys]|uniref:Uncharacterized protein n=1 Tax=Diploscapter pachys TaxID=2018661 RepID=A0A2A2K453_9BILA|nr:hypothetical protein WR25_16825 [Diploscapter pachys]